jgi:hypothetical protein
LKWERPSQSTTWKSRMKIDWSLTERAENSWLAMKSLWSSTSELSIMLSLIINSHRSGILPSILKIWES